MAGGIGNEQRDDIAFLKEAIAGLSTPALALPLLLSIAGTAATTLLILSSLPAGDDPGYTAVHAASAGRLLVQLVISIAAARILNHSPRPPWSPDRSFWAFLLIGLLMLPVAFVAGSIVDLSRGLSSWLALQCIVIALTAPLLPWLVAIGVERPLAWRPAPYFGRFGSWLPPLLLWSFLILAPATLLYQFIETELIAGPDWSPWLLILDGLLNTAVTFLGLALASVAYSRVARS
jgi:hypothetical protein